MNKELRYRVNSEIKEEYDGLIEQKYENKHSNCGKTIENLMKLYLTANGYVKYQDDPEVRNLINSLREDSLCTHTHSKKDDIEKHDTNDDDWKTKMEKELLEIKEQLLEHEKKEMERKIIEEQRRYKDHSMDRLVSRFQEEYGDDEQVSITDISKLIMRMHGVMDKRSIHNRVQYLIANGCIEPFAPNVYNIK